MSLLALAAVVMACLSAGYLLYGRFIARQFHLDSEAITPAVAQNDGVDFVPARPFYLMGQHFSAIAAAGPIVGPILACMVFGWLPCILWIVLGVIFIGAVHDFAALIASVRHGAHSIAEIARQHLGRRAWVSLSAFIWLALVYVIVAFADVTALTFVGQTEELAGEHAFNPGGAVAAAATMYLGLAIVMGIVQRFLRPPMWLSTLIFVPATLGAVWLGTRFSTVLILPGPVWHAAILAYCFIASLLPLWLLQQPRGYLGGFILYIAIAVGVLGILFGGFEIQHPATIGPTAGPLAFFAGGENAPKPEHLLFPFLFVTIACGACSGFHGLVCGGTTSKQIAKETDCKPIGFGAMLLEGFVAVIALATVMILTPEQARGAPPGTIYGNGLAAFITALVPAGSREAVFTFAATFGAMAFSTFVFDTLDVATRLGRYLLQELTGLRGRASGTFAAAATAGLPLLILFGAQAGSWKLFWTLFGTSNQLLASLTLLGITVWLARTGRRYWYTLLPLLFVMAVTISALVVQITAGFRALSATGALFDPLVVNAAVAAALLALAVVFIVEAARAIAAHRRGASLAGAATT